MQTTQSLFDGQALLAWLQTLWAWLQNDVVPPINIVYSAMQLPAIIGTGFVSWWIHDFVYHLVSERVHRRNWTPHTKSILRVLTSLLFPLLWASGLWFSIVTGIALLDSRCAKRDS